MKSLHKHLLRLSLALCLMAPLAGCSDKDDSEPVATDHVASAEVTYTYTVSEDMLRYFNITAVYYNASGEKVGKHMDSPVLTITTTATKFPAKIPLTFTITRTETPAPTNSPNWSESMTVVVKKYYSPSGNMETSSKNEAQALTPSATGFSEWANRYMSRMATGYSVTIDSNGKATFTP